MRVLVIKMSSMGDVFHTIPALTDAQHNVPNLTVDWVVEKGFAEIPTWHPVVDKVFSIELRKWRKTLLSKHTRHAMRVFFAELKKQHYDLIIDAQGLLKSAWVATKVKAPVAGYDRHSIREPLASWFYDHKFTVSKDRHAIWRIRHLFAKALGYPLEEDAVINYGLNTASWPQPKQLNVQFANQAYWVFLHGTTWTTKLWPEDNWQALLAKALADGKKVMLPWGNEEEKQRALRLQSLAEKAAQQTFVWVPEQRLSLHDMAKALKHAEGVVSVDTGLSHVCAAMETPMVVLYRVTDPILVGADGPCVTRLASPCAPMYLKKFADSEQQLLSLQGIGVVEVYAALIKQIELTIPVE